MELPMYFTDFLRDVRLDDDQKKDCEEAHKELSRLLKADETLKDRIIGTFLQGSYRRSTLVKPLDATDRPDVDVVVVTNLHEDDYTPRQVLDLFIPFVEEHYEGRWEAHDRSIRLRPDTSVELDLVVTAAPSESQREMIESAAVRESAALEADADWRLNKAWIPQERRSPGIWDAIKEAVAGAEWKSEPLRIPARDLGRWVDTNPLEQIRWTRDKNGNTGGHYVNVVKSAKWWRVRNDDPKYPKGYPLEHLVGYVCPDGITSVASGLVTSLETIRDFHPTKPYLLDHGVTQNVFDRVSDADYAGFHALVADAAAKARAAFDAPTIRESALLWRDLLGPEFPVPPETEESFAEPKSKSAVGSGRFGASS